MSNIAEIKKQAANTQVMTIFDYMEKNKNLIRMSLPNSVTAERLTSILTMVIKGSPALMQCTQESLVAAIVQCCQVGLFPGSMGHIYFMPRRNKGVLEVQSLIGFKGICELVNRSEKATILTSEVVYEKDAFSYELGLNPRLAHVPASGERGKRIGVYAIAKNLIANEKNFIFIQAEEIEKIKNESLSKIDKDKQGYSPWVKWEDEMWKKTAVKRIAKLLPISADVQGHIASDETIKTELSQDMTQVKDKTEYEDAEVVAEHNQKGAAGQTNPETITPEQSGSPKDRPSNGLLEAGIGSTVQSFIGKVVGFKQIKSKNGKDITYYSVEDDSGDEYRITKFGSVHEGVENAICVFENIKVSEYNGKRDYLANSIKLNEEIAWEE